MKKERTKEQQKDIEERLKIYFEGYQEYKDDRQQLSFWLETVWRECYDFLDETIEYFDQRGVDLNALLEDELKLSEKASPTDGFTGLPEEEYYKVISQPWQSEEK